MFSSDDAVNAAFHYLRVLRLNESKINFEWKDCARAINRRRSLRDQLRHFVSNQLQITGQLPVILSSEASRQRMQLESFSDRGDASASCVLLLLDRMTRRLHASIGTGTYLEWRAGDAIGGFSISQVIAAGSNAIRHADEWASLVVNGAYDVSDPRFARAQKSIVIVQSVLNEPQPIREARSADILNALASNGDDDGKIDILLSRLASVGFSQVTDTEEIIDELEAEEAYAESDFDFVPERLSEIRET